MILTLAISGYRSIRDLVLPLERLNIVTGPNGSGKSSFYRALRLLSEVAQGQAIQSLAREGGLPSTLWAGPENVTRAMKSGAVPIQGGPRAKRVALKLGFASEDYGYGIDLGPSPNAGAFALDPEIKAEALWAGEVMRRSNTFATRRGPAVQVLDSDGKRVSVINDLALFDSMMTHAADPRNMVELTLLRDRMRRWRFYDHFDTTPDAPARRQQVGTRTPVLASDGHDIAAAIQTILEIGNASALEDAIEDAFPGSRIDIHQNDAFFEVTMSQHGLLRPLRVGELSDGTLRYLLLVAALLTPRPPELMVLNEPETSLHPDLLEPLARLIINASESSQIIVVSHAAPLVEALSDARGAAVFALEKQLGETVVPAVEPVSWHWPPR